MNVIFYILDALRPDFLGCYGFKRETSPFIDLFSKDGVIYENAYSTTTWTKASAAAIITSQYPITLQMMHEMDNMPDYENTLPRVLKRNNFKCYAASSNLFFSPSFGFSGFDEFFNLQMDEELQKKRFKDPEGVGPFLEKAGTDKLVLPLSEDINEKIFPIFKKNKEAKNFIMVWSVDTHPPFFLRNNKSFFNNYPGDFIRGREVTNQNKEKAKSLYCDMIRYNDTQFGELISEMKKNNLYEDSLIIVAADHGEAFGEHKGILGRPSFGHSGIVYEEMIKVPLIVKYPNKKFAGKHCRAPVQLIDIYPTILDVLHIEKKDIELEGQSLNPLNLDFNKKRVIFTESQVDPLGTYSAAIRIGDKKMIKVDTPFYFGSNLKKIARNILEKIQIPSRQFYNLFFDPLEKKNLEKRERKEVNYFLEKYYEIKERCDIKKRLVGERKKNKVDEEVKKRLRGLGYFDK